jgi:serine/threonine protein kinase
MDVSLMSQHFISCIKPIIRSYVLYTLKYSEPYDILDDCELSICGSILTIYANTCPILPNNVQQCKSSENLDDAIYIRSDGIGISNNDTKIQKQVLKRKRVLISTLKKKRQDTKKIMTIAYSGKFKFKSLDRKHYIHEVTQKTKEINNEIKILRELNHKNIIKLLQYYSTETKLVLVYQQCLNSIMEIMNTQYILQLLDGLSFIHNKNLIHCNISPKSVLVTHENVVKITNFKYTRSSEKFYNDKISGAIYEPPEEFWTMSRDVFALGCLLRDLGNFLPELIEADPKIRMCYVNDFFYDVKLVKPLIICHKFKPKVNIDVSRCDSRYKKEIEFLLPPAKCQQIM